jgi:hypothetical protein
MSWHWLQLRGLGNNNEKLGIHLVFQVILIFRYYYTIKVNPGNRSQCLINKRIPKGQSKMDNPENLVK